MTGLEKSLRTLIDRYDSVLAVNRELAAQVSQKERQIADLEQRYRSMKASLDSSRETDALVKKLKQERMIIRRELDKAMSRLAALEQGQ